MPRHGPDALDRSYTALHLLHASEDTTPFGRRTSRFGGAFGTSILTHVFFGFLCYLAITLPAAPRLLAPERMLTGSELIWVEMAGPGGGGGGGGNESPAPAQKLDAPGPDATAIAGLEAAMALVAAEPSARPDHHIALEQMREMLQACCEIALDARGHVLSYEPRPDGKMPDNCCDTEKKCEC